MTDQWLKRLEELERLARESRAVGVWLRFALTPDSADASEAALLCCYALFREAEPSERIGLRTLNWERGSFFVADEWLLLSDAFPRLRQLVEGSGALGGVSIASTFQSIGSGDRTTNEGARAYSGWPEWSCRFAFRNTDGLQVPYGDVWNDEVNYHRPSPYQAAYELIWKDCPTVSKTGSQFPEYSSLIAVIPDRRARFSEDLSYSAGEIEGRVEGSLPPADLRGMWRRTGRPGGSEDTTSHPFSIEQEGRFRFANPEGGNVELVLFGEKIKLDKRNLYDQAVRPSDLDSVPISILGEARLGSDLPVEDPAGPAAITEPGTDFPALPNMYQPVAVIGRGGFGRVYRYRHRLIERDFAVKVFAPMFGQGTDKDLLRFRQEADHLFRLRHRYIIAVHDIGETEAGAPFIRMEFFEGKDLSTVLREQGRRPFGEALDKITKVAEAIAHAHANKVFHRDLKASNVLFSEAGDCRVIDFGLSILVEAALEKRLTTTGEKPAGGRHTAPELMQNPRTLDPRSDIFSIGTLWYEMVVGRLPSTAPEKTLSEECADLPAAHRQAILRCLEEKPERRFESAETLLAALKELVGDREPPSRQSNAETALKPEGAPIDELRLEAVETIREYVKGDKTGWRQLVRRVRANLSPDLLRWRSALPPGQPPRKEAWTRQMDRAVDAVAPVLALSLVAADADSVAAVEPTDCLAAILAPSGWDMNGFIPVTRVPRALGYLYHHVVGALLVRNRLHADAARLLLYRPRDREEPSQRRLVECEDLTAWPDSLFREDGFQAAHAYLTSLYKSRDWLSHFFATKDDWLLSIHAYALTASLFELGLILKNKPEEDLDTEHRSLLVPPVFLYEGTLDDVQEHAFPNRSAVDLYAQAMDLSAQQLRRKWPEWHRVWLNWVSRAHGSGFLFRVSRSEPPVLP
jgi:serine/threonine-protein kinase